MWDLVRDRLAPIDVVTVDAPGFGGSPSGAELQERYGRPEPSLEVFVEAIRESLDELEVERVVLGGMSMGGTVAATFAQTYPERVAGLALMDTNIGVDDADHAAIRRESIALCDEGKGYESVKEWSNFLVSSASPESVRQSLDRRFRLFNSASLAWLQRALLDRDSAIGALTAVDGPILRDSRRRPLRGGRAARGAGKGSGRFLPSGGIAQLQRIDGARRMQTREGRLPSRASDLCA